jgi:tetratricopeptide (TPR) repeat protein
MAFTTAIKFDNSDLYWRSKAEVAIATAQKLAGTINSSMSASTTQAVLTDINNVLNRGIADAKMATAYNPKNYYNYISEARVAEIAAGVKMPNGYENALKAYNSAIGLNPYNPSLYLNLANFEAKNSKYDDAIRDLGRALQVKNNYLDAVFLLSQVYSAKGDIQNAITAASVAVQLNPQNSVLLFQLGLLKYYAKDYAGSTQALEEAIKYQPDYANAKYFLGLSLARQNNTTKALAIFEELAEKNSDNQEIALIIANLRSGRSIFTDVKNPVTATPEKRAGLPVKEKK